MTTPWTPGPWAWMGMAPHNIYLATQHSGRRYVLGFTRWGMRGAQPVFNKENRLIDASELLKFEVGDGKATGFTEAKRDETVYRYDIAGIDHPDARLLAKAPEVASALLALTSAAIAVGSFKNGVTDSTGTIDEGEVRAGEAIDKACKVLRELGVEI